MVGYKLFTPEWTAVKGNGVYQYEVGKCYEELEKPQARHNGFHFCKNLIDCFGYYGIEVHNRIALIDAYGEISENGTACATNKMKIVREIPWRDAVSIIECQEERRINGTG